jgi:hypothetical protein
MSHPLLVAVGQALRLAHETFRRHPGVLKIMTARATENLPRPRVSEFDPEPVKVGYGSAVGPFDQVQVTVIDARDRGLLGPVGLVREKAQTAKCHDEHSMGMIVLKLPPTGVLREHHASAFQGDAMPPNQTRAGAASSVMRPRSMDRSHLGRPERRQLIPATDGRRLVALRQ